MSKPRLILAATLAAMLLLCVTCESAFARGQLVAGGQYTQLSSSSPNTSGSSATNATASTSTAPSSTRSALPYTGMDVVIAAALGVSLLGAGFTLRRALSQP